MKRIDFLLIVALLTATIGTYAQHAQRVPQNNGFHKVLAARRGGNSLTGKTVQFDKQSGNTQPHKSIRGISMTTSSTDFTEIDYSTTIPVDGAPVTGTVTAASNTFNFGGSDVSGKGFSFNAQNGKAYLITLILTTTGAFNDYAGWQIFDSDWNYIWGDDDYNGMSSMTLTGIYYAGSSGSMPLLVYDYGLNDYSYTITIKEFNIVSYTDIDYPLITNPVNVTGSFNINDNLINADGSFIVGKGYTFTVQNGKYYKITAHFHSTQAVWAYPEADILTGGALQGNYDDFIGWAAAEGYPYGTDFDFIGFFTGDGNSTVRILISDYDWNDMSYTFTIEEMQPTPPSYTALSYPSISIGTAKTGTLNSTDKLYMDPWNGVPNGEGYTFTVQAGKTYTITCSYFSQNSIYFNTGFALLTGGTFQGDDSDWYDWTRNGDYGTQNSMSLTYIAPADGAMRLLLYDYGYNNLFYSIKVTEAPAPPTAVSLTYFLNSATKMITYSNNLQYADAGYTTDLVQGDDNFRWSGDNFYAASYMITMSAGDEIQIHSSKEWDSYLYVYQLTGVGTYTKVDEDDDSGGCNDFACGTSYIDFTAPADGTYYIIVTDYGSNNPGNYVLKVWNNSDDEPNMVLNSISSNQTSITTAANATENEVRAALSALVITGSVDGSGTVDLTNNPYVWVISGATGNITATFMPTTAPYGYEFAPTVQPIIVHINGWTGMNDIGTSALKAWTSNGALYVSGLSAGEKYSIFTLSGICLARGTASGNDIQCLASLPAHGVYILQTSQNTVKVVN